MAFLGRSSQLLGMIFYKLMLALVEAMAGVLCLLGAFLLRYPAVVSSIDAVKSEAWLERSVQWSVHYIVNSNIADELLVHAALILFALALLKIFIAVGLWFKSHKMRKFGILLFAGLASYSVYHLLQSFSTIRVIALASDLFFLFYFWKILPKHLER